jgi:hypothetical protein
MMKATEWEPNLQKVFEGQGAKLVQKAENSGGELSLRDMAKYVDEIPEKTPASIEYKEAARKFLFDLMEKERPSPEFEQAKRFWAATEEIKSLGDAVRAGPGTHPAHAGLLSGAAHLFGIKGLIATKVLTALGDKAFGEASMQTAANAVLNRQAVLAHVKRVDDSIAAGVRKFLEQGTPPSAGLNPFRDISDDFDKTSKEVSDAGANLPYTTQQMANSVHGISQDMPAVAGHVTAKASSNLQNLRMRLDALHQSIVQPKSVTPLAAPKTQLPDSSKYQWLREQRAIRNPLSILDDIQHHQVYPPAVEALKENWPKVYEQLSQEMLTQASEVKEPLSRGQYEVIAQVLGQPSDGVAGDVDFGDWLSKMAYNPMKKSSIKSIGNQREKSQGVANMSQTDSQRVAISHGSA